MQGRKERTESLENKRKRGGGEERREREKRGGEEKEADAQTDGLGPGLCTPN